MISDMDRGVKENIVTYSADDTTVSKMMGSEKKETKKKGEKT